MKMQPVRGTHDLMGEDVLKFNKIIRVSRDCSALYGFSEISTPIFEFTDVFLKPLGESSDIVTKEMYTFEDRGGESITLRPEGTAPVARAFISQGLSRQTPVKLFYQGPMFRYERPQKGRYRQFYQLGIELIGIDKPQADIECLSLGWNILCALGLENKVRLEVNSIGDQESRLAYREKLVAFLQSHKNSLSEDSQKRLESNPLRILDSKDKADQTLLQGAPTLSDSLNEASHSFFDQVCTGIEQLNIPFSINPNLVRGLDYYCHTVFEFKTDELGAQDAILSGGRYNQLIENMGGPKTPGVGFAAGIDRLALLLDKTPKPIAPVTFVPLGEAAEKACLKLCHDLRAKGFAVDMGYGGNLSKRMKKADKVGAIGTLLIGDDELAQGIATWKHLATGAQEQVKLTSLEPFLSQMMSSV